MSTIRVNTIQNTSGVEQYLARAWVNFNGTGTVAIRASGNVSSITDNGVGDYTVNFTAAMVDANYSVTASSARITGNTAGSITSPDDVTTARTTSAVRVRTQNTASGANEDSTAVNIAIFR